MSRAEGSPNGGDQQVVRWYTRARRFPQLIGRTPDGARIPGGPYTITQVATAGVLMFVALKTTSLWAHYGLLANGLLLVSVVYGVVFLLGKIPLGSRNPAAVVAGAWRALTAPTTGRLGGRPVRLRRPHPVQHRMTVFVPTAKAAVLDPVTSVPPAPIAESMTAAAPSGARPAEPAENPAPQTKKSRRQRKAQTNLGHRRPAPKVTNNQPPDAAAAPAAAPTQPQLPAPAPAPAAAPALSGVQALLAQGAASAATPPMTHRSS